MNFRATIAVSFVALALAAPSSVPAQDRNPGDAGFECLIQPMMVLKLGTPVPGVIREVLVDRGAEVKKGDVVARLESGVETAAVELAKARAENKMAVEGASARLEFLTRKSDRMTRLRKSDNVALSTADEAATAARVAESELHEAEVNLNLAKLDLERASEILKQRTIRSPIDGVVVERSLGPGEYIFEQAHLLTLSQIDPLRVEVYVPLSQFGKISAGMKAEVFPEEPVGGKYSAAVTVVDQVFDAASGTIGIRLELPNPDHKLPAGLRCHVRFAGIGG
jgi:RND family efflux transporter MFP subunit